MAAADKKITYTAAEVAELIRPLGPVKIYAQNYLQAPAE